MDARQILRDLKVQIQPESIRPEFARIIVTRNCPLRCQMCTFWRRWKSDPSFKEIKYWIDELADFGVKEISIGGGEPFIRKDLPDIVDHIKSYGIRCGITTSGWMVDSVPLAPADHYEVSIDGPIPEVHDKIRGRPGSWEKAVKTVKLAKKKYAISQINMVLQADNYEYLLDYCEFAKSLGVKVSIIPISPKLAAQPRISKKMAQVDPQVLRTILKKAMKTGVLNNTWEFFEIYLSKFGDGVKAEKRLCPYYYILIFSNSDVYPCGNFDQPVGKLTRTRKLKKIYQDYEKIRKEVAGGCHKHCLDCTYPDIIPFRGVFGNVKFYAQEFIKYLQTS